MPTTRAAGLVNRRSMLVGSALAGVGALVSGFTKTAGAQQLSLYVFVHTHLDARALGRRLETALPGTSVQVLTRSRDFSRVRSRNPDGVIALAPVLKAHGFTLDLQGHSGGRATEPYVLLSPESVSPSSIRSVGAVDILGRREMPAFVASLLGGNTPAVTPVTKLADLLALLQFQKVEAVVLPAREAGPLKNETRLILKTTQLNSAGVGLPAFSKVSSAGERLKGMVANLPSGISSEMGVDSWR